MLTMNPLVFVKNFSVL